MRKRGNRKTHFSLSQNGNGRYDKFETDRWRELSIPNREFKVEVLSVNNDLLAADD